MCFVQLYRFMALFFLTRDLQKFGVNQSEILFLTREKVKIAERIIHINSRPYAIEDTTAYCLWLLINSLSLSKRYLFITKLA
ncbi:hypothetical protein ACIQXQ_01720 [Peribacillus sp. NPDC097198]|uniref:hypothetical protein n=1 Tax=Peribacillus sp. NPDC097198 TaxID=3364397 RepID=UPI0037FCC1A4